jgi:hypothetical protein
MLAALLLSLLLDSPQAVSWYGFLLEEGGYGRLEREKAAFLIAEGNGTLTLQPWPAGGHRRASFRGRIPERAIAVLHTHPRGEPRPSANDRAEAKRLGLPVVVITPEAVIAAMPDGRDVMLSGAKHLRMP